MELKDVILSTLAEMEENSTTVESVAETPVTEHAAAPQQAAEPSQEEAYFERDEELPGDEKLFLQNVRERLLVLFEGFQSPNNTQIEAKIDLTLNFLEYLLATIDARLDTLSKKEY